MDPKRFAVNQQESRGSTYKPIAAQLKRSESAIFRISEEDISCDGNLRSRQSALQQQSGEYDNFTSAADRWQAQHLLREQMKDDDPAHLQRASDPKVSGNLETIAEEDPVRSAPCLQLILVLVVVLLIASSGPLYLIVEIEYPVLRASWRAQLSVLCYAPVLYFYSGRNSLSNQPLSARAQEQLQRTSIGAKLRARTVELRSFLQDRRLMALLCASAFFLALWMCALSHTVVQLPIVPAHLLTHLHPVLAVAFSLARTQRVSLPEKGGALLVLIALLLLLLFYGNTTQLSNQAEAIATTTTNDIVDEKPEQISVIALGAGGALCAMLYYHYLRLISGKTPQTVVLAIIHALSAIILVLLSLFFENTTFSFNETDGIFGFLSWRWFFITLLAALLTCVGKALLLSYLYTIVNSAVLEFAQGFEILAAALICDVLKLQKLPSELIVWAAVGVAALGHTLMALGHKETENDELKISLDESRGTLNQPMVQEQQQQQPNKLQIIRGSTGGPQDIELNALSREEFQRSAQRDSMANESLHANTDAQLNYITATASRNSIVLSAHRN